MKIIDFILVGKLLKPERFKSLLKEQGWENYDDTYIKDGRVIFSSFWKNDFDEELPLQKAFGNNGKYKCDLYKGWTFNREWFEDIYYKPLIKTMLHWDEI